MAKDPKDHPEEVSDRTVFLKPDAAGQAGDDSVDAWFTPTDADAVAPAAAPDTQAPVPPSVGWDDIPSAPAFEPRPEEGPTAWSGESPVPPQSGAEGWTPTPPTPGEVRTQVPIGATLNHIYQVRRLIARGGMGEVYEGVNISSDERVAIKVILQHLASDPRVQAAFRGEARALTRISHPALVQYRLLAKEPDLDVFYIVTEFIEGVSLADVLSREAWTAPDLTALTRRLAEGLRAAHDRGIFHRDMSPDNVLLAEGRLTEPKIIDFGIAKDANATNATIVGDGFAGKLNFVAPEQFGAYGGQIGAWTDVYSLALVILAMANGKAINMGATLADALQRRQQVPDLSRLPEVLRPVFAQMLAPDPKDRLASMEAVIEALANPTRPVVTAPGDEVGRKTPPRTPPVQPPKGGKTPPTSPPAKLDPRMLMAAGGAVVALVVLIVVLMMMGSHGKAKPPTDAGPGPVPAHRSAAEVVESVLPNLACSWIEVEDLQDTGGRVSLTVRGASGSPQAAISAIRSALAANGTTDFESHGEDALVRLDPQACATIDVLRRFRAPPSPSLAQDTWVRPLAAVFHFQPRDECRDIHHPSALTEIDLAKPTGGGDDMALLSMENSGKMQSLAGGLSAFRSLVQSNPHSFQETASGLHVTTCDDRVGGTGVIMIRGAGPFDLGLAKVTEDTRLPPATFPAQFEAMARRNNWRTQMAWYAVAAGAAQ